MTIDNPISKKKAISNLKIFFKFMKNVYPDSSYKIYADDRYISVTVEYKDFTAQTVVHGMNNHSIALMSEELLYLTKELIKFVNEKTK